MTVAHEHNGVSPCIWRFRVEPPNHPTAFRERWYLIAIGALLGVLLAGAVAAALPRTYESTATLFLRIDAPQASLLERSQFALARIKSYPDLVKSPTVLRDVISDLDLETTPAELAPRIEASNQRDTVLLNVTATARSAEGAAQLANAVARSLSELVSDLENSGPNGIVMTDENGVAIEGDHRIGLELTLPATPPTGPASPQVTVLLGLGLLGGLALGASTVAVISQLDPRVRSVREVRRISGLPVVGELAPGLERAVRRGRYGRRTDEALRATVVNLRLMTGSPRPAVLVVIPAGPGTHARAARAALARTLSEAGRRVLLVTDEVPPSHGIRALYERARDAIERWGRPTPDAALGTARVVTVSESPTRSRHDALLAAVRKGIESADLVIVGADRPDDVFTIAEITGAHVVVVANSRATTRSALVTTATAVEFTAGRPTAVLLTGVPGRARIDLPTTWTESDRSEATPVSVPAAPAPSPHKSARKRSKGSQAARTRSGGAKASGRTTGDADDSPAAAGAANADSVLSAAEAPRDVPEPLPGFDAAELAGDEVTPYGRADDEVSRDEVASAEAHDGDDRHESGDEWRVDDIAQEFIHEHEHGHGFADEQRHRDDDDRHDESGDDRDDHERATEREQEHEPEPV